MPGYEYKVVPAPRKGQKSKGLRTPEARFAYALQQLMNELATDGWEYQRAETLPSLERSGLASSTKEWRHVLVFRRPLVSSVDGFAPDLLPPPDDSALPAPEEQAQTAAADSAEPAPEADAAAEDTDQNAAPEDPPEEGAPLYSQDEKKHADFGLGHSCCSSCRGQRQCWISLPVSCRSCSCW